MGTNTVCFRCMEEVFPCDDFPFWSHAPGSDHKHGVNPISRELLSKKKPDAEQVKRRIIAERVNRARRLRDTVRRDTPGGSA